MRNLLNILIVAFVSALVTIFFQDPIQQWWHGDGLKASLIEAPWAPYPSHGQLLVPADLGYSEDATKQMLASNSAFGVLELANEGRTEVKDASIATGDYYSANIFIPTFKGHQAELLRDAHRIPIPDMAPGDRMNIYIWNEGYADLSVALDDFKTYSSEGPFSIKASEVGTGTSYKRVDFLGSVLDYMPLIAMAIGFLIMLVLIASLSMAEGYYKRLLGQSEFYAKEKARFDEDAKKFRPAFDERT